MRIIEADPELLRRLDDDAALASVALETLRSDYATVSERFHRHLRSGADHQHQNALFHRIRYLDLLSRRWTGDVLDVGNDKPFLSYFLRKLHPAANFSTISYEIPETPVELHEVDIEQEVFPFPDSAFDHVLFTEVIEHLWRNPSHSVFEINRVLRNGGSTLVTTPNACDRHALVCVLWQANPNQRSGYYATLESGHLHLWTLAQLKTILESHEFAIDVATTVDLYGHTKPDDKIEAFIREICPNRELMNETLVVEARKLKPATEVRYPAESSGWLPGAFRGRHRRLCRQVSSASRQRPGASR